MDARFVLNAQQARFMGKAVLWFLQSALVRLHLRLRNPNMPWSFRPATQGSQQKSPQKSAVTCDCTNLEEDDGRVIGDDTVLIPHHAPDCHFKPPDPTSSVLSRATGSITYSVLSTLMRGHRYGSALLKGSDSHQAVSCNPHSLSSDHGLRGDGESDYGDGSDSDARHWPKCVGRDCTCGVVTTARSIRGC